jgi:dihydrolipoamide dehydrogenase
VSSSKGHSTIQAAKILIATGGSPIELPFLPFDEKKVLSSTGALSLPKVPKSMLVIGAGVIGLELASVYMRLGTKITVVEMLEKIAPTIDQGIGIQFKKELEKQGMTFHLGAKVTTGEVSAKGVTLSVESNGDNLSLSGDV